jgi:hypothetical protein
MQRIFLNFENKKKYLMKNYLIILGILCIFTSCFNNSKTNTQDAGANTEIMIDSILDDTTKYIVCELPIVIDSTDYFLQFVGYINVEDRQDYSILSRGRYDSSEEALASLSRTSYEGDRFTGNISNIIFENIKTQEQSLLTKKMVKIYSVEYLRFVAQKTKHQYLLYTLFDKDNNGDNQVDSRDVISLYISDINGEKFTKVSMENFKFLDGKFIKQNMRYYFRAREDIDKNGIFAQKDKLHHYYIEFSNNGYSTQEYFPLEILK